MAALKTPDRVVCVVARVEDPATRAAVRILTDWSAAGLLDPFLLASADDPAAPGRLVVDGVVQEVQLQDWIATHPGVDLDTAALQLLDSPGGRLELADVEAVLGAGQRSSDLVNVLVPSVATTGVAESAAFAARCNLLLQPVQSLYPGAPTTDVRPPAGVGVPVAPTGVAQHAAAGLATAVGLWSGCPRPLVTDRFADREVRVFRGFVRRIEAGDVLVDAARSVFTGEDTTLPRTVDRGRGELFDRLLGEQALAAAESAADALARRHEDLLLFVAPEGFQRTRPLDRSAGQVLAEFLRACAAGLRGAHRQVAQLVFDEASRRGAGLTQRVLLGDDSDLVVVLHGVRPDGSRASDTAAALSRAGRAVLAGYPAESLPARVRAGAVWRDVLKTGTALGDGAGRDESLPVRGQDRVVLTEARRIAPDPLQDTPFVVPAGVLPADVGELVIGADDPHQADRALVLVQERQDVALEESANGDPTAAGTAERAARTRAELRAWVVHRRGFSWRLGSSIGTQLEECRRELLRLTTAGEGEQAALVERARTAQPDAQRVLLASALWCAGIAVATGLALWLLPVEAWKVLVGTALALGLWLGFSASAYGRAQIALFQLRHRSEELARERSHLSAARATVARRLVELADLYGQATRWSAVLGAAVHRPFGTPAWDERAVAPPVPGPGPLTVAVARAVPVGEHSALVHGARAELLATGWLGDLTRARIRDALADRAVRRGEDDAATRIWDDPGGDDSGPLAELLRGLTAPTDPGTDRAAAVRRIAESVESSRPGAGVLWPRLDVVLGEARADSGAEFLAPLAQVQPDLDGAGFSAAGIVAGANAVTRSLHLSCGPGATEALPAGVEADRRQWAGARRSSLDGLVVRADLGPAVSPSAFACFTPTGTDGRTIVLPEEAADIFEAQG